MKKNACYANLFCLISLCFVIIGASCNNLDQLPEPYIQAGTAKLSGKVSGFQLNELDEAPTLMLYTSNPVTAKTLVTKATLSEDGLFSFEVPIECSTSVSSLSSNFYENTLFMCLTDGKETSFELINDGEGNAKITMEGDLFLSNNDLDNLSPAFVKMLLHQTPNVLPRYSMSMEEFIPYEMKNLERKLAITYTDSLLSKKGKQYLTNEFKLFFLHFRLFDYKFMMKLDYLDFNKDDTLLNGYTPKNPSRSYYGVLKRFDLNNPLYLYNESYATLLQTILSNDTLNIPLINDSPIEEWLKEVKPIMADLVGFKSGLFYDMLAANAYAMQFNEKQQPLSERQLEAIKRYFKNKGITDVLLRKNEEIKTLDAENRQTRTTINQTPNVPNDVLMKTIVSKYTGSVVLIDFWATWCGPCMAAMDDMRAMKKTMKGKNIVFVYMANESSPRKLWEAKAPTIGGEHYYLGRDAWAYISEDLGIDAVPTYLIYDTNGLLKHQVTGYPGNEKMQAMLKDLLQ